MFFASERKHRRLTTYRSVGIMYWTSCITSLGLCVSIFVRSGRQTQGTRLESYRKLKTENAYAADSSRYSEAKRAKFKEISKINKSDRKR